MGFLSCLEPPHRSTLPDTPPELPGLASSSCSSQPAEHPSWRPVAPLSPPMSHYDQPSNSDMSTGTGPDDGQPRRDTSQAAPRQQLPPLSSLFGPQPPVRSLRSPALSDRPHSYSSTSPLDRPVGPPPSLEQRSYSSSSYFPPAGPSLAPQPRSAYDARYDDRSVYPPLPRTSHPGHLSPRPGETEQGGPPRHDYGSANKWPSHPGVGRSDYALGREQVPFKAPQDSYPPPLPPTHKHSHEPQVFREYRPPAGVSNAVTADGIPVKDALGPKIWTGTHFLPRFVRAAEVPGEGMCYFYDDGSHCKTVIDGEAVNAHWGVTKAGKPRKRLAIACVTCREKKIKCDPDYPRCLQCEKFGRVCKFKNAPRGGHNGSPGTPPAELDRPQRIGALIRPPPVSPGPGSVSSASLSPRTTLRPASPDLMGGPSKRLRTGYEHYPPPPGGQRSPLLPAPDVSRAAMPVPWQQPPGLPRLHEDALLRAWQTDPYVSDPQSVNMAVASFFTHTDATALRFLPEQPTVAWIRTCTGSCCSGADAGGGIGGGSSGATAHARKSPEDLMLVYSILALGAALSDPGRSTAGEYADVARYAVERWASNGPSLPLVQARLVLAMYYTAISRQADASDVLCAAISTALSLQMNWEAGKDGETAATTTAAATTVGPLELNGHAQAECRRRTFWACFVLERLNGLSSGRPSMVQPSDIFLRLPMCDEAFEEQTESTAPIYEPDLASMTQHPSNGQQQQTVGVMGYLVLVASMWGDVLVSIDRPAPHFHHGIASRLERWRSHLPERLDASQPEFLTQWHRDGEAAQAMLMHTVYHMANMKLHRHIHSRFLTPSSRSQYTSTARRHASALLELWCRRGAVPLPHPFVSSALVEAADILTAEGTRAADRLPPLIDDLVAARAATAALGGAWAEAQAHAALLGRRTEALRRIRELGEEASSPPHGVRVFVAPAADNELGGLSWLISDPMEARFPRDVDAVYGSLVAEA